MSFVQPIPEDRSRWLSGHGKPPDGMPGDPPPEALSFTPEIYDAARLLLARDLFLLGGASVDQVARWFEMSKGSASRWIATENGEIARRRPRQNYMDRLQAIVADDPKKLADVLKRLAEGGGCYDEARTLELIGSRRRSLTATFCKQRKKADG